MLSGQRLRWSAWFFVLMAGVLVAVVTVTVFFVLRFPFAPSVAMASVVGTVAGDAVEARRRGRPLRWSSALAQAGAVGAAVWVALTFLRG